MKDTLGRKANKAVKQRKFNIQWHKVVTALAAVAVFWTTYALILPAITWSRSLVCEIPEHLHDESCYETRTIPAGSKLVCTEDEHEHSSECYEQVLICTKDVVESHTHGPECYGQKLICTEEECEGHTHGPECYEQVLRCSEEERPGHTHGPECYQRTLICTEEECQGHTHGEGCFNEAGELICQLPESAGHTHSDSCWREDFVCQLEESEGHTHGPECYESVLRCTEEECEGHTHGPECYEEALLCTKEEREPHTHSEACNNGVGCPLQETHVHTEACYESKLTCTAKEHTHTDDCYETVEEHEEQVLICEQEEHEHTEACFDAPPAKDDGYYCDQIEHVHSEEQYCYFSDGSLRCTIPEHEHTLACKSNPQADLECEEDWCATFADVELSGKWSDDALAIARTQIGYWESSRNYEVANETDKRGYTRYGAWYGLPCKDWCAMFCSFCLNYAGVDPELMPIDAACPHWIDKLSAENFKLYHPACNELNPDGTRVTEQTAEERYIPVPGDLVFFDWENYDPEHLENRRADHVGFVSEVVFDEETNEPIALNTIEGNIENCVVEKTYEFTDGVILGYGSIPENPDYQPKPLKAKKLTKSASSDKILVVAASDFQDDLPENVESGNARMDELLASVQNNFDYNPYAFLFGGDYSRYPASEAQSHTQPRIETLDALVTERFGEIERLYLMGNHDYYAAPGLASQGAHDTPYYGAFVIDYSTYPAGSESSQRALAAQLESYLKAKADAGYTQPVFVLTHVPFHHSDRLKTDNAKYAKLFYDACCKYGDSLNIIVLVGHNHSGTYDDYLGGSSFFFTNGDQLPIPDEGTTSTFKKRPLNFTYMTYGYVGFYGAGSSSSSAKRSADYMTVTTFEIAGSKVTIRRWNVDGAAPLKKAGTNSSKYGDYTWTVGSSYTLTAPTPVAQEFTDEATGITATAVAEGLTVEDVTSNADDGVSASDVAKVWTAYEFSLNSLQGTAEITVPITENSGYDTVWQLTEDGALETVTDAVLADGKISFTMDDSPAVFVIGMRIKECILDEETGVKVCSNGSELTVSVLESSAKLDAMNVTDYTVYDIKVEDFTGTATVYLPVENKDQQVWYLGENEKDPCEPELQDITICTVDGVDYARFVTTHFSDWGVGTQNVTYWQKVTALDQLNSTDTYMIVKDNYALAANASHAVLSGDNALVTITEIPDTNGTYTISGNGTFANFTWKYANSYLTNVGTNSKLALTNSNVLTANGNAISASYTNNAFRFSRNVNGTTYYLSESGGTFSRQNNTNTAGMTVYKQVSEPTYTRTVKSGSNSSTTYTVSVYGVEVDDNGDPVSSDAPAKLGTVTINGNTTSSSPVVPESWFNDFKESDTDLAEAIYVSAYFGRPESVDKDKVTALYRSGSGYTRYLGIKSNNGNETTNQYLSASDPKGLFVRYKAALPNTYRDGDDYKVKVYGVQVDEYGNVLSTAPTLLGTVTVDSTASATTPVVPETEFASLVSGNTDFTDADFVSAYYGTADTVDKDIVTALYRSGTDLSIKYGEGQTASPYLSDSDDKALYVRYTLPVPNTWQEGNNYKVKVYGIHVDDYGNVLSDTPILLDTVTITPSMAAPSAVADPYAANVAYLPGAQFLKYVDNGVVSGEYAGAYFGTFEDGVRVYDSRLPDHAPQGETADGIPDGVDALFSSSSNNQRYLGVRYQTRVNNVSGNTIPQFIQGESQEALYIMYTDKQVPTIQYNVDEGKAPDHRKYIDSFRDGDPNPDTLLDDNAEDLTDLYRVYLDVGPETSYDPLDVVIMLDLSNSMSTTSDATDLFGTTTSRLNALWGMLYGMREARDYTTDTLDVGSNGKTGLLKRIIDMNPENNVVVTFFSEKAENGIQAGSSGSTNLSEYHTEVIDWFRAGDWKDNKISRFMPPNGTNYTAAMIKMQDVLKEKASDGRQKIVIFVSDGEPNYFTYGYGGNFDEGVTGKLFPAGSSPIELSHFTNGYSTVYPKPFYDYVRYWSSSSTPSADGYEATIASISNFKGWMAKQGNITLNTVAIGKAGYFFLDEMPFGGASYGGNDFGTMLNVMEDMITRGAGRYTDIQVCDTISSDVKLYVGDSTKDIKAPENADLKVHMVDKDGVKTTIYENGAITTDGAEYLDTVTVTDNKTITVDLKNVDYVLHSGLKFTVSYNIETLQSAYDNYAANVQNDDGADEELNGYLGNKGEKDTDYADSVQTNTTSSNKPGWNANCHNPSDELNPTGKAEVRFKQQRATQTTETDWQTAYYDHPVVQVWTTDLEVKKNWSDGASAHTGESVSVEVWMKALPDDFDPDDPITDTVRSGGTKIATLTLSSANNWTAQLTDLPRGYYYYLKETQTDALADYTDSYDPYAVAVPHYATGDIHFSLEVKNTKKPDQYLVLKKTDMALNPLSGAQFKLYADSTHTTEIEGLVTSGSDGVFTPDNFTLESGEYYLVETHAPSGYKNLTDHVRLVVRDDSITAFYKGASLNVTSEESTDGTVITYTLPITNSSGYNLPATGGMGVYPIYALGALLIAGSVMYGCRLRRKRERRAE